MNMFPLLHGSHGAWQALAPCVPGSSKLYLQDVHNSTLPRRSLSPSMVPPCSCETTRPDLLGRWATVAETELAFHTVRASSCLLSASWPLAPPRGSVSAVSRQGTGHPLSADRGPTATSCCWRTPLGPQTQGPQRWCVPSGLAWCNLPIATFFARSASLVSYPCSAPPQSPFQIPPPLFQPLVDSSASLWGPFATLSFVPLSSSSFFSPLLLRSPIPPWRSSSSTTSLRLDNSRDSPAAQRMLVIRSSRSGRRDHPEANA